MSPGAVPPLARKAFIRVMNPYPPGAWLVVGVSMCLVMSGWGARRES